MAQCLPNSPNHKNRLGQLLKIHKFMEKISWTPSGDSDLGGVESAFLTSVPSDFV